MKKLVITGALGHIGSRLIRSVTPGIAERVVLVDNLLTQRYSSLFDLPAGPVFEFLEQDVTSADLEAIFDGAGAVVHLAAITNAEASVTIAPEVERVNWGGTQRVADACCRKNVPMIFLSTTSVYGTQSELVDENCPLEGLKPQSPYAGSKLRAEQLLQELGRKQGLRFVICRFGTIFGWSIGMRFHTAINKFCWQAVLGHPVTVWKTAFHQKRPYLDLGDAVRAILFLLTTNRFDREIYNVLTVSATVEDIVDVLKMRIPDLKVSFVESQIMNQLSYQVSNSKFTGLGFTFEGRLQDGMFETLRRLWALGQDRLGPWRS